MESDIFSAIGLGGLDPAILFIVMLVLLIIAFVLVFVQSSRLKKLERKYNKFMNGKEAESLEEEIVGIFHNNRAIKAENDKNRKDIIDINKRMAHTVQKLGLHKYDAFDQTGGKLSYAICFLDEEDSGILINSVHSADGINYSYSKNITAGVADVELTGEEKKALEIALNSVNR